MNKTSLYELSNKEREIIKLQQLSNELKIKANELNIEEEWFKHQTHKEKNERTRALDLLVKLTKYIDKQYCIDIEEIEKDLDAAYKRIYLNSHIE